MTWFWIALIIIILVLCAALYSMMGLPRLWGEFKGEPYCGHPFEQTWGTDLKRWMCPKCLTYFEVDEARGRWVMVR